MKTLRKWWSEMKQTGLLIQDKKECVFYLGLAATHTKDPLTFVFYMALAWHVWGDKRAM